METNHEEMKELIAAYVVGAVPPDEVPTVRAHILSCEECLAEADGYSEAAAALALTVEAVEPPSGFVDRVMAQIDGAAPVARPARRWRWGFEQTFSFAALIVAIVVLSVALVDARHDADFNRRVLTAMVHGEDGIDLRG
jgi:anti-sigma factor RsiW